MSKETLLQATTSALETNPYDVGHDLQHHLDVWDNCKYICEQESLELNLPALKQAALWHDYARGSDEENHSLLLELGRQNGVEAEYIALVIGIMSTHSFGEAQASVEQEVLFDADKVEYVNPARFVRIIKAVENGQLDDRVWNIYKKLWCERIVHVRPQLHFQSSIDRFDAYFKQLEDFIKTEPRLHELRVIMV